MLTILIIALLIGAILSVFAVKVTDWTRHVRRAFKMQVKPLVIAYLAGFGTFAALLAVTFVATHI